MWKTVNLREDVVKVKVLKEVVEAVIQEEVAVVSQ
jgi:hypothetical protein